MNVSKKISIFLCILLIGCVNQPIKSNESQFEPCGIGNDFDNDSIVNGEEIERGLNPCSSDSDGDGINDFEEIYRYYTNPLDNDTDNDSIIDGIDPAPLRDDHDKDGDGFLDQYDYNWSVDLYVNSTININYTGDNITWTTWWNGEFLYTLERDQDYKTNNNPSLRDWPDNKSQILIEIYVNSTNDYYSKNLPITGSVTIEHSDDNGTLQHIFESEVNCNH